MKESKAVAEARALIQRKNEELKAAEASAEAIKTEIRAAHLSLRAAQEAEDSERPQCRMVMIEWRRRTEEDCGKVVILRKTATGTLVVRRFGDPHGNEEKFKQIDGRHVHKVTGLYYRGNKYELRDVPPEFLPNLESRNAE